MMQSAHIHALSSQHHLDPDHQYTDKLHSGSLIIESCYLIAEESVPVMDVILEAWQGNQLYIFMVPISRRDDTIL